MPYLLAGKKALVTGSTDGLGRKIVLELARREANIIVHGRDRKKVDGVVKELREIYPRGKFGKIVCDLNKLDSIEPAFSGIRNLDILVNNAGAWLEGNTADAKLEKIIELVNVNLGAPLLITRTLFLGAAKSQFGQILNVVSIVELKLGGFYHTIYSATKFGLQALAKPWKKNMTINSSGLWDITGGMETNLFKKPNDYQNMSRGCLIRRNRLKQSCLC